MCGRCRSCFALRGRGGNRSNSKHPFWASSGYTWNKELFASYEGELSSLFLEGDGIKFVGPGHNAEIMVDDNEDEWFLYHAVELTDPYLNGGATRRPLMLDKIHWDEEAWPYIGSDNPGTLLQTGPYFAN